jgi:hypothetical protein
MILGDKPLISDVVLSHGVRWMAMAGGLVLQLLRFASFRSIQTKFASPLQSLPAERAQGGAGVIQADHVPARAGALVL